MPYMVSAQNLKRLQMTWVTLIVIAIGIFFITMTNAQFGFGGAGNGATDPTDILLQSPNALRQCYSFSGQLNNIQNPQWGSVNEPLLRVEGNSYRNNDWHNFPQGANPRDISNLLSHETCASAAANAEQCYNDWFWLWGQMVDHDLSHIPTFPKPADSVTDMTIRVSSSDPFLANRMLPHLRSYVNESSTDHPNDQINLASSYLDSSQIYGSTIEKADSIRTFRNGMLKSTRDGFMPILSARLGLNHSSVPTFDELGSPSNKDAFLCADMRCNQHGPMASFQTLYIREHNRIAAKLSQANHPAYQTDEAIYQAARALVIAMNQAITYNEFVPLLLGRFDLPAYQGYQPSTRATLSNAFATAGFRTLHSMVGCDFKEMTSNGQVLRSVSFATSFFDSTWIRNLPAQPNRFGREQNAFQTIMNGLGRNPSTHFDHKVSPVLRSVVFTGATSSTGARRPDVAFDVVSSDIIRGRDHGLLSYRAMRERLGWRDVTKMEDLTLSRERVDILKAIYGENIDNVDLIVGMMTEDPLEGSLTGPVTTSVLQDQFRRTRDGDRCFYRNQFNGALLQAIHNTRLKDLVDRTFDAPNNPFASEIAVGPRPQRPAASRMTVDLSRRPQPVALATPVDNAAAIAGVALDLPIPQAAARRAESRQDGLLDNATPVGSGDATGAERPIAAIPVAAAQTLAALTASQQHAVATMHKPATAAVLPHDLDRNTRIEALTRRLDVDEDATMRENDPMMFAQQQLATARSSLDNGRGVRPAQTFDDVVGYVCGSGAVAGQDCVPVALESDPVLTDDPEVQAVVAKRREELRQEQQQQQQELFGEDDKIQSLFGFQNRHAFQTMQVAVAAPAAGPNGQTSAVRRNTGLFALSPAPGVTQTDQRSALAAQVQPSVLTNNIFLTPQCRR